MPLHVRIGQHPLAHRPAAPLGVDALNHGLDFRVAVAREQLAHVTARIASVLEPHQAAGMVGTQLPVTGKRELPRLATKHRNSPASLAWHPGARVGLRSPSNPIAAQELRKHVTILEREIAELEQS
jgi:hypothetical protein